MRTAESVLFTCWPPAPDARNVSMRRSAGLIVMSATGSGLGNDGDRARRRVDAPLRLGLGHALHAMAARLELELASTTPSPAMRAIDLLVAAELATAIPTRSRPSSGCARRSASTCGRGRRRTARSRRRRCPRGSRGRRCARRWRPSAAAPPAARARAPPCAPAPTCAPLPRTRASPGRATSRRPPRGRASAFAYSASCATTGAISACSFDSVRKRSMSASVSGAASRWSSSARRAASWSSLSRSEGFMSGRRWRGTAGGSAANDRRRKARPRNAAATRCKLMPGGGRFGQLVDALEQRDQLGALGVAGLVERRERRVQELVREAARQRFEHLVGRLRPSRAACCARSSSAARSASWWPDSAVIVGTTLRPSSQCRKWLVCSAIIASACVDGFAADLQVVLHDRGEVVDAVEEDVVDLARLAARRRAAPPGRR